mmetsp:Transcript_14241/g.28417  ORF Transcript_14241/g.28417 Transcript_14241/m.28417 type:complete len:295 (-) Transcript_14241:2407-3291(-)
MDSKKKHLATGCLGLRTGYPPRQNLKFPQAPLIYPFPRPKAPVWSFRVRSWIGRTPHVALKNVHKRNTLHSSHFATRVSSLFPVFHFRPFLRKGARGDFKHVFGHPGGVLDAAELGLHQGLPARVVLLPERKGAAQARRGLVVGLVHLQHHVPDERVPGSAQRVKFLQVAPRKHRHHAAQAVWVGPRVLGVLHQGFDLSQRPVPRLHGEPLVEHQRVPRRVGVKSGQGFLAAWALLLSLLVPSGHESAESGEFVGHARRRLELGERPRCRLVVVQAREVVEAEVAQRPPPDLGP